MQVADGVKEREQARRLPGGDGVAKATAAAPAAAAIRFKKSIVREVGVVQTPRLKQMIGLFDVPPAAVSRQVWDVDVTLPGEWNVGVIVGPSGSGKTTVAREMFGERLIGGWDWPADKSVVDGFPKGMGIKDVTALMSSVGFSSPPAWVRPFGVLSNGQQFRVSLARTLAEASAGGWDLAVVDEFTSVVDRTAAKIGSAAVAATVRRRGQRFVAVTCHYDVVDWLAPDWVYEPHLEWLTVAGAAADDKVTRGQGDKVMADGSARGLVRPGGWKRPGIELEIVRVAREAWGLFKGHHYLSGELHKGSKCFVGLVEGQPAVFTAVLSFPHPVKPSWREHRTVCLPDFQGVGIGNAMSEYVASLFRATGKPYTSTTSHPSMIRHRSRSKAWRMTRAPGIVSARGSRNGSTGMDATTSMARITAGFEYVGEVRQGDARAFGVV